MGAGVADSRAHTDWAHTALALLDVAAVEKELRGSVEAFPVPGQWQLR